MQEENQSIEVDAANITAGLSNHRKVQLEQEINIESVERWVQDSPFSTVGTESSVSCRTRTTNEHENDFIDVLAQCLTPSNKQAFESVSVSNSEKEQSGNVTNILGPVHIVIGPEYSKDIYKSVRNHLNENGEETDASIDNVAEDGKRAKSIPENIVGKSVKSVATKSTAKPTGSTAASKNTAGSSSGSTTGKSVKGTAPKNTNKSVSLAAKNTKSIAGSTPAKTTKPATAKITKSAGPSTNPASTKPVTPKSAKSATANTAGTSTKNTTASTPKPKPKIIKHKLQILSRKAWLAKPHAAPLGKQVLNTPVQYVIISHTAGKTSAVQSENEAIIRGIQAYHMGTLKWGDLGYNFLVGGDAKVYTGRGWKLLGAHTSNYNAVAIGISFVGLFTTKLPTAAAMEACKLLIAKGVADGHISPSFKLLGHCQCVPTESPVQKLFQELKTWPQCKT